MTLRDQLRLKIILEERFRKEVRRLFSRIRIEFRIGVSTGNVIRAAKYKSQWAALIQNHYSRVQRAFKGVVKNDEKQSEQEDNDAVLAALLVWADQNTDEVATAITNTTQSNMDNSIDQARQLLIEEGSFSGSSRELSLIAAVVLGRKFRGRETGIIMTETQRAAESTKLIEAFSIDGQNPMSAVTRERVQPTQSKKEWQDVGDKDVRNGHHAGEVAAVAIDQPFIVNGQQMMYPGDSSRGASIGNTANCRCGSFYTFN